MFVCKKMLEFAFNYFNLDYRDYILKDKKFLRPVDIKIKSSKYKESLIKKKLFKNYTYGKKKINIIIKKYLNNLKKIN